MDNKQIAKINRALLKDVKDFTNSWDDNTGVNKVLLEQICSKYLKSRIDLDMAKLKE
jgi:hypothetical protein